MPGLPLRSVCRCQARESRESPKHPSPQPSSLAEGGGGFVPSPSRPYRVLSTRPGRRARAAHAQSPLAIGTGIIGEPRAPSTPTLLPLRGRRKTILPSLDESTQDAPSRETLRCGRGRLSGRSARHPPPQPSSLGEGGGALRSLPLPLRRYRGIRLAPRRRRPKGDSRPQPKAPTRRQADSEAKRTVSGRPGPEPPSPPTETAPGSGRHSGNPSTEPNRGPAGPR